MIEGTQIILEAGQADRWLVTDVEEKSVSWLKKQLPRHTKVNLKPKGSVDGVLEAKVIPFNSNIDIAEKYINQGLATNKC